MASIKFDITGNANGFVAATRQAEAASKSMFGNIAEQGRQIDETFKKIATSAGALFTVQMASQFSTKVAQVRGEFQQLEVAFETMLQSKEKADALMVQIVDTAAKTPFDLQGVANGAKQLLAYGVASEEVNDTLIRLGDIAAGLSIPLNDLVYLYGTTLTQGRLFTQDLRQFQGRGIPLADELAKQFGVTKDAVAELVTAGKVGFPEVEKAIKSMTGEGGKFNNLMAKQSKTITGQISNLEDAIDQMFNQIGQSSEGVISNAIGAASSLVENYEKVGRIIGDVVIAYGTYKAVLISINAVKKAHIAYIAAETTANRLSIKTTKEVTAANVLLNKAMKALNKTMMLNPYVLAATAVAGLVVGVIGLTRALDSEKNAHENVAKAIDEQNQKLDDNRTKAEELMRAVSDEASTEMQRVQALEELRKLYPGLFKEMSDQEIKTLSQVKATKMLAEETERLREEELKRSIQQKTASLTATKEVPILDPESELLVGTKTVGMSENYIKTTRREIELLQEELDKLIKLREQAEFNQQPKEVQIVTLQGQIEKLKEENAELDKQIKIALAKKFTLNELGNLNFDWSQSGNADAMLAQQEANQKVIADLEKKLKEIQNTPTNNTGGTGKGKGKKEHKATKELKTYEAAVNATRKIQDLEHRANVSHLETIKNDKERERKIREEENKKEIQDIERQKEDYINSLLKAQVEAEIKAKGNNARINLAEMRARINERADVLLFDDIIKNTIAAQTLEQVSNDEKDKKEKDEKEKEDRLNYLKEYGDFKEQVLAITEEYNDKIAKSENEWEKKILESERDKILDELIKGKDKAYQNIFKDPAKMSLASVKDAIKLAQSEIKKITSKGALNDYDLQKLQALQESVDKLQAFADSAPFAGVGDGLDGVVSKLNSILAIRKRIELAEESGNEKAKKDAEEELAATKDLLKKNLIGTGVETFASSLMKAASAMKEIAEAAGDVKLSGLADQFSAWAQNFTAAGEGAAAGGWIGAIVGGVSDIIAQTVDFFISSKISSQEALNNVKDFRREIELIKYVVEDSDFANIFGTNHLAYAKDALDKAKLALDDYESTFATLNSNTLTTLYENEEQFHSLGAAVMLGSWGSLRKVVSTEMQGALEAYKKGYSQLEAMQVKTKDVNGWGNFWGFQDEYTSLKDLAPELWDKDGVFNVENAKVFLETNTQINEQQRKQIQNIIDLKEAYDEANEVVESYLESLFGSWGEDLGNIISDSVLSGIDAWDEFEKKGSDVIKTLGKQAVYSLFFEDTLNSFMEPLKQAVGNPDEMALQTAALMEALKGNFDAAEGWLKQYYEQAEEYGFDIQGGDRTSAAKGIAQASQESIDVLNGMMTNIQSHTFSINQQMASVVNIASQLLAKVTNIDANTSRLGAIESNMKLMREDISTIATRGIIMR